MGAGASAPSTKLKSMGGSTTKMMSMYRKSTEKSLGTLKEHEGELFPILLLGQEGVGKSTISKQFLLREKEGGFPVVLIAKAISSVRKVLYRLVMEVLHYVCEDESVHVGIETLEAYDELQVFEKDAFLTKESELKTVRDKMKIVWGDEIVQEAFTKRKEFLKPTNINKVLENDIAEQFIEEFSAVFAPGYTLTKSEYLKVWQPTQLPQYYDGSFQGTQIQLVDVGGQTHQQTTLWKDLLNHQAYGTVAYVVSLNDYAINVSKGNRLVASLEAFKQMLKNPQMKSVPVLLIFNKKDMFEQSIQTIPLAKV
jgi:GTPase SAR1 family protein